MEDDSEQENVIEDDYYAFMNIPKNVREYYSFYLTFFSLKRNFSSSPRDRYVTRLT